MYRPRGDFVIIRKEHTDLSKGGVAIPEKSDSGWRWYVEAVGPKVKDLLVGDEVLVMGTMGQDVVRLLGETKLHITRQDNVFVVVNR